MDDKNNDTVKEPILPHGKNIHLVIIFVTKKIQDRKQLGFKF